MKSLYAVILVLSLSFAACDSPTSTKKSSSSSTSTTQEEKKNGGSEEPTVEEKKTPPKPANKTALVAEIKKAIAAQGNKADLNYIDTSDITNMIQLFAADDPDTVTVEGYGLHAFEGDISKWDVSAVTNMYEMFRGATTFNQNISGWDVSSVTDMAAMFVNATAFKQNLNKWGSRLNDRIKEAKWFRTRFMFLRSGLASNLPDWCEKSACKNRQ